jgi:hypothetical protein
MKKIPKASYQTPEQIAERIKQREEEAALLPLAPLAKLFWSRLQSLGPTPMSSGG